MTCGRHRARRAVAINPRLAALPAALALLLGARFSRAQCTMDTECKGNRVCEDGKCADPSAAPATQAPAQGATPAPSAPEASAQTPLAASAAPSPPMPVVAGLPPSSTSVAPRAPAPTPPPPPFQPRGRVVLNAFGGVSLTAAIGSDPQIQMYAGGGTFGLSTLVGFRDSFPGENGGNWHGLEFRSLADLYIGGVVYPNTGALLLAVRGTTAIGYEFFHVSQAHDGKQPGLGVYVGATVGLMNSNILFPRSGAAYSGVDPTVGGVVSLVVLSFDVASRHMDRTMYSLYFDTLPGTGLTFATFAIDFTL